VCARYRLDGPDEEGLTVLGGRRIRYRLRDVGHGGRRRRLMGLDWGSGGTGKTELLVAEHYGFSLHRHEGVEQGIPYELFVALAVSGGWVRRYGVHRPAAFAFWSNRPGPALDASAPRVGCGIYFPGLRFRLPLLPDIDLDDFRLLGLPMPLLDAEDLRHGNLPSWLATDGDVALAAWKGVGPPPDELRAMFPDR
jgi:hypothetical protein